MKVVVLYRPNSDHSRTVEEFVGNLERRNRNAKSKVELVNIDTKDGWTTASLYDIVQYPAILAIKNDGQLLKEWHGNTMPLLNEVSYYTHDN